MADKERAAALALSSAEADGGEGLGGGEGLDGALEEARRLEAEAEAEAEARAEAEAEARAEARAEAQRQQARELAEHSRAVKALAVEAAFEGMGSRELHSLVRCAKRRMLPRYAIAYRAGAAAAHVFVLLEGRVQKLSAAGEALDGKDEVLEVDAHGSARGLCFGMEALIASGSSSALRRTRTLHAACDSVVLQLSVADLERHMAPRVLAGMRQRHFAHYVQGELRGMPIFDGISADVLTSLASLWELEEHGAAGSPIFAEGDRGDKLYVLLQGRVCVLLGKTVLTTLDGDGQGPDGHPFFGEMALLDGKPRMAAVASKTPCTLLVLPQRAFAQFMLAVPDFKRRLRSYKELRARQTELKVAMAGASTKSADANDQDRVKRLIRAASNIGQS